ncbi:MAG: hypothetical protein MR426_04665 [Clostridiales bacterium]|nr:hypothetical protein [Clostridiales bacterium]
MAKTIETIEIKPIEIRKTTIRIVGDTPLIMHAWSEKAKREILDKQMKKTKSSAREAKNPVEDFIRSMYWLTPMPEEMSQEGFEEAIEKGARFGFPVTGFKQAAISAAYRMGWAKDKVSMRGAFFIDGDENQMLEIHSDTPVIREDMVKVGMGTADIRFRGEFRNWYADLTISYNANGQYTLEQIVNIINAGGYVCGVGEWRPERDGQYGMFHVASE